MVFSNWRRLVKAMPHRGDCGFERSKNVRIQGPSGNYPHIVQPIFLKAQPLFFQKSL
jgi:ribosomal protein L32E